MKLFFCQNDPLMGEPFWQNNSLVSHILFELQPIIIFSPVANFGNQSLITDMTKHKHMYIPVTIFSDYKRNLTTNSEFRLEKFLNIF